MNFILDPSWSPMTLIFLIIVFSWLWEDGALIAGSLLALDERMSAIAAVSAIFIGISSGDMMLYGLGRLGRRWRWMRYRLLKKRRVRQVALGFKERIWSNIFIVRFIPGLRTIGFTSCGYWGIHWFTFLSAMSLAGVLWISIIFNVIYRIGNTPALQEGPWRWSPIIVALFLLVANNLIGRRIKNRKM